MMEILQISVGAGVAILIIKEVLNFVQNYGNGSKKAAVEESQIRQLHRLESSVRDLHNWHDQKDTDGVYVWYVRRSLEDAMRQLAINIETEARLLEKVLEKLQELIRKDTT